MDRLSANTMLLFKEIGQNPTTTKGQAQNQPNVDHIRCYGAAGPDIHNIYGGSANEILCLTGKCRCWLS